MTHDYLMQISGCTKEQADDLMRTQMDRPGHAHKHLGPGFTYTTFWRAFDYSNDDEMMAAEMVNSVLEDLAQHRRHDAMASILAIVIEGLEAERRNLEDAIDASLMLP